MKKVLMLVVVLAMTGIASAELVSNGGFEDDTNIDGTYWADGWNKWEWYGWSGFVNNDPLSDGGGAGTPFTAYEGTAYANAGGWEDSSGGITFDITPAVGESYIASIYYSTEDWGADNQAQMAIKWWGDFGEIKQVFPILDEAGPMSTWEYFSVNTGIVPVGTTGGQFEIEAGGTGTVLLDNASMVVVPEPMTMGLLGLGSLFLRRRKA